MRAWISDHARPLSAGLTVVVLGIAVLVYFLATGNTKMKHLTVYFPSTIGIYTGSSVRVLGVPVGTVDSVTPLGTTVKVTLSYKASVPVPASAGVAQVTPSVVSDRYLQLVPGYTGGPLLADHAVIQEDKTEVPVELDQIFGSLNDLNVALGPNGANKTGALAQLIDVGAANLKGNGAQFNATLKGFAGAINTLSNSRDALFGTLTSLQQFTTTLANDDAGVRTINGQLDQVSAQLAGERQDLGQALAYLATALGQVQSFVADNRDNLTSDIHALTTVTSGLVSQQQAIKEVLDEAPPALYNLVLTFNPSVKTCDLSGATCSYGALVTRTNNLDNPTGFLCQLLTSAINAGSLSSACAALLGNVPPAPSGPTLPSPTAPPTLPQLPTGGLVGGLLGGIGKAFGGSGSSSSTTSPGTSGSSGGGLLGNLLTGGAR
ncbi:MAG TPA: MCE family protein [Mycobacteriales bacterium]